MVFPHGDNITLCTCIDLKTHFLVIYKECYFPLGGGALYHINKKVVRGVRTIMCNTVNFLLVLCNSTASAYFGKMVSTTTVVAFYTLCWAGLVSIVLIPTFVALRLGLSL